MNTESPQLYRTLNTVICLLMLSACAKDSLLAPVGYPGRLSGSHYVVQKGDTLYSVAFRFGLDYKSLARANHIKPPYTIFINQKIRVKGIPPDNGRDSAPDPVVVKPESPSPPSTSVPPRVVQQSKPVTSSPVYQGKTQLNWIWPVNGQVAKPFSLKGEVNKGIDISGKHGESVVAAEDGVVVYAGGGLRGYGKLVIVKHNDRYLSAYGNNDSLLVKEGQKVKAGERIARIAQSGNDPAFLHFEIRRDGKPQNPLRLLPKGGSKH